MEKEDLKLTNLFLDTQVFVEKNFNFDNKLFQRLIELSESNSISIYLTEVTKEEIKSKIHEQVYEKVKVTQATFSSKARILKNLPDYNNVFDIIHKLDEVYEQLVEKFNLFIEEANICVLSIDQISPSEVFKLYFNGQSPFSSKKKDEFPDAFSLLSLEHYFREANEVVFVVSNDKDLESYCTDSEHLNYLNSLESFMSNQIGDRFLISVYQFNLDFISETVEEAFNDHQIFILDLDGEVTEIIVNSIELDNECLVTDLNEEELTATINFNANVSFFAKLSYTDYSESYYDKEEGKHYNLQDIHTEIADDLHISVTMDLSFSYRDMDDIRVLNIILNENIPSSLVVTEY